MTYAQQRYFCATAVAIIVAVLLRMLQIPAPWPAAIAIYVYGVVAQPIITQEVLPNVRPGAYAAIWLGAALFVIVSENLGAYAGW